MGRIKILDSFTANKIAAGEIVEGPSAVIKELLENSLDAQADFIEIEMRDGGLSLIRVTDNGIGMDKEDAFLAFERHATSKISNSKDLFNINTFGFRGEALPSIASVSTLVLITKEETAVSGIKIKFVGGSLIESEEMAFSRGTSIEVRNLFFNTPARRKFLKGISYETGQITELITKYSLGHPGIRFKLVSNQKVVYDTAGLDTVDLRLNTLYGKDLENTLIHIPCHTDNNFKVQAWLAPLSLNRNTRNQQTFFINGRLVKSMDLSQALDQAYHTLLPKGRFPVAVIHLTVSNINLDVNIHPAKLHIKIHNIKQIQEKIVEILKEKLVNKNVSNNSRNNTNEILFKPEKVSIYHQVKLPETTIEEQDHKSLYNQQNLRDTLFIIDQQNEPIQELDSHQDHSKWNIEEKVTVKNIPDLLPIGQVNNSFILAQNSDGLYIIDQHTCHERILYERFLEEEHNKNITSENLLIPATLTLSGKQESTLINNIVILNNLGFVLENFGERTYLLRSIPVGTKIENSERFFIDLLEDLEGLSNLSITKIKESILIMSACKSAIKANQKLINEEIIYLLKELALVKNPHTCPHGRPIIHKISMQELYKIFQRGEYRG